MLSEEVLKLPARVLTQAQREFYHANGYLLADRLIDSETIARLNQVTDAFIEQSRDRTQSDNTFDLAPEHTRDAPMIRRIKRPDEQHRFYWEVATGVIADVVADLLGPDVIYHHSKLNFKWHGGDDTVAWHQDIQFYPHTNYSPLTVGSVGAGVSLADRFVILRRFQHVNRSTVHQGEHRKLFAFQQFFDDDRVSRVAELVLHHHHLECRDRVGLFGANDNALARRQTRGLHHHAPLARVDEHLGILESIEDSRLRGRHLGQLHERLRVGLVSFDPRRGRRRPEDS